MVHVGAVSIERAFGSLVEPAVWGECDCRLPGPRSYILGSVVGIMTSYGLGGPGSNPAEPGGRAILGVGL